MTHRSRRSWWLTCAVAVGVIAFLAVVWRRDGVLVPSPRRWISDRGRLVLVEEADPFPLSKWICDGAAILPDGQRILSRGRDEPFLRLWNASGGTMPVFGSHDPAVSSLAVDRAGQRALSGGYDHALFLWDFDNGKPRRHLKGHQDYIAAIAFLDDGQRAVSGSGDGVVLVWNLTADVPPRRLPIDSKPAVTALAAHADLIAVGRSNGGIELWSVEGNALLHCLPAHDDIVECLVFLADGATLISAGRDGSLLAWDPHAGKRLREFPGHANWITSLAVAPSGRWFASASDDLSLRLWDAQTGEALDRLDLAGNGVAVVALRFLSDDLLVAVTSNRLVLRFAPS